MNTFLRLALVLASCGASSAQNGFAETTCIMALPKKQDLEFYKQIEWLPENLPATAVGNFDVTNNPLVGPQLYETVVPTGRIRCCATKFDIKQQKFSIAQCDTSSCVNNFGLGNFNCANFIAGTTPEAGKPAGSANCPYQEEDRAVCDVSYYNYINEENCRTSKQPGSKPLNHCLGKVRCATAGVDDESGIPVNPAWTTAVVPGPCSSGVQDGRDCFYDGASQNYKVCGEGGGDDTPGAPGSCCLQDGSCCELRKFECLSLHGIPGDPGTMCPEENICPKPTACCLKNGDCEDLMPVKCGIANGHSDPDGMQCASLAADYCPAPVSCCLQDGSCCELSKVACLLVHGMPGDPGTSCPTTNICPQPTACCLKNGDCEDLMPGKCAMSNGFSQGDSTDCSGTECPAKEPCCFKHGTCEPLPPAFCKIFQGFPLEDGDCSDCPVPVACCLKTGDCLDLTPAECASSHGASLGDDTNCDSDDNKCPAAVACCLKNGDCLELTPTTCAMSYGVSIMDDTDCGATTCPAPGLLVPCCLQHAKEACAVLSFSNCLIAGGTPQHPDKSCSHRGLCPAYPKQKPQHKLSSGKYAAADKQGQMHARHVPYRPDQKDQHHRRYNP